jgi:hypothetical protein
MDVLLLFAENQQNEMRHQQAALTTLKTQKAALHARLERLERTWGGKVLVS